MNESLTGIAFAMSYIFTQNLSEEDQYLHSYFILGIVGIILSFNIFLVILDTLISLYEVFSYIREKGFLTYVKSKYYEQKLQLAINLPKPVRDKVFPQWLNVREIVLKLQGCGVDAKALL